MLSQNPHPSPCSSPSVLDQVYRPNPNPEKKDLIRIPDQDTTVLKFFHLLNGDFNKKLLPLSFFDGP